MARNPRSDDGSKLPHGEFLTEADALPRNHPVTSAGFSSSGFGAGPSADAYRQHAEAAAREAAKLNTGAADGSAPVPGLEEYLGGGR